ncbi:MAG: type II secretion system F family protein [Phycisphaerales bacterium]|nr:MAG: type II secretion system F family protein [Phycisphaerales bacterium]
MSKQELLNTIIMASVFVLVFSGWTICVVLWVVQYARRRKRFRQRMGLPEDESKRSQALQLWRDDYETRRKSVKRPKETLADQLERLRASAGWKTPAHLVLLAVGGLAVLAGVAVALLGYQIWLALSVGLAIVAGFHVITKQRIAHRITLFETQLVDSLRIAARALRAGHPLVGAFQAISDEIGDPVGPLFGDICQQQTLGLDLQESIRKVADSARNADLKLFATAVSIQMTTGGNLADVMERLVDVMRSRMRLNRRVRILTAQSRASKNALLAIPVVLFLLLNVISPDYVAVMYTTSVGVGMLVGTVISMAFGAVVMGKMSQIKY